MFDMSFWSSFISNLLATLVGIVAGVPIALALNRRSEKKLEEQQTSDLKERVRKILTALNVELTNNLDAISHLHEDFENYYHPVRDQSWRAFSDGGEIQWVNDVGLLDTLSIAYAKAHQFDVLHQMYAETYFSVGPGISTIPKRLIFGKMREMASVAEVAMVRATGAIDQKLKNLGK